MIKYVLHPQWASIRATGQRLYINAEQLARFYSVPYEQCIINGEPLSLVLRENEKSEELIHLYPSYEGDYDIQANNNPARNLAREYTESMGDERTYNSTGEALDREEFLRWLIKKGYIAILEKPKETK